MCCTQAKSEQKRQRVHSATRNCEPPLLLLWSGSRNQIRRDKTLHPSHFSGSVERDGFPEASNIRDGLILTAERGVLHDVPDAEAVTEGKRVAASGFVRKNDFT